jgi:hypothetical protein
MPTRYDICKETLICNTEYAKKKNINIAIFLFDTNVTLYTNIKISDESKNLIQTNYKKQFLLFDNSSYDDIIKAINLSRPEGGTDFLAPYELLDCINEFKNANEIFFLSDGENNIKLTPSKLGFIQKYKSKTTTMGIGHKETYDHATLSLISKTNDTVEGSSADIIQQELLSQMADGSDHDIDNWYNIKVTLMGPLNNFQVGSIMKVEKITEDMYKATKFKSNVENKSLVIENYNNNIVIKKLNSIMDSNINFKTDLLLFMVDQSGSMDIDISSESLNVSYQFGSHGLARQNATYSPDASVIHYVSDSEHNLPEPAILLPGPDILLEDEASKTDSEEEVEYVRYTMNLLNMKYYQRVVYKVIDLTKFKAKIEWEDSKQNKFDMVLDDSTKYINVDNSKIEKMIELANEIGHNINIASISSDDNNIGNFRKINSICNRNKDYLRELSSDKDIIDFSLSEILFYNKKHGLKLYYNTLSPGEVNIQELLQTTSCSASRMLSAAATMSVAVQRTPSSQPGHDEEANININRDMSLCTICYSEIREYIFSCGHCYACKDCAEKVLISEPTNKCSYCKQNVTWIRKITMTESQKDKEHYFKCITEDCYNVACIVSSCDKIKEIDDDDGYHLTYCEKCFSHVKKAYKRVKKTHQCFCGKDILKIKENIYFN